MTINKLPLLTWVAITIAAYVLLKFVAHVI